MNSHSETQISNRYQTVTEAKLGGVTYTPKSLADFVAQQIVRAAGKVLDKKVIRVLDPAVGDGELLVSLLQKFDATKQIEVYGFDTDQSALLEAQHRLTTLFPNISINLRQESFLDYVLTHFSMVGLPMFVAEVPRKFDLIIANPPYVRTQIIGAQQASLIARHFNLTGRIDLYYAFLIGMASILESDGIAGIIVSNRFMSTKSGATVRAALRDNLHLRHIWDLGDTKLFDAAVLPSIIVAQGKNGHNTQIPNFTTIYETTEPANKEVNDPLAALSLSGIVSVRNGRRYVVKHGKLDLNGKKDSIWRLATESGDAWLATVEANTWGTFRDIGKIRVGVKTCADKIYIRSDWDSFPKDKQPELLRPLSTHHIAQRFKALSPQKQLKILYPHTSIEGNRQTVDIDLYPAAKIYLEQHRTVLEARKYVMDAGRKWFEIWVPQDPTAWKLPKLIFRDISEKPVFWIDQEQTVVNGDCYWMIADNPANQNLLWLAAAVANSTFAEAFYDHRFNNKLYSGRRRFITQYVELFPLPDPSSKISRQIIDTTKAIYDIAGTPEANNLENILNTFVWKAFGFSVEEIKR